MIIWLMLAGLYALHLLLKLHWITTLVIGAFLLLRLPHHRKLYKRKQEEALRFSEVSEYMDTLLYAFAKEEKVERALMDTEAAMMDGSMRELVQEALDHLHMTFDDSDVMRDSLRLIEREYRCKRLENIHEFMVHVEQYGGAIARPVDLLLEDKSRWEKRIRLAQNERDKMFVDVVLSIAASLIICGIILYLPAIKIDISGNVVAQVLTVVVVILDDWILSRGQRYLAVDWLTMDAGAGPDEEKKIGEYYQYNEQKDRRLSLLLCAGTGIVTLVCFWLGKKAFGAAGLLLMVLMANQHRVGRHLARKNLVKSVKCAFPGWLLDMILLLQSENVQVALQKSQEHAPGILKRDLQLLSDRLELEPESARPYHMFMQEFQIPEVHAAMSMLFSLSAGSSGRAERQISELIVQNLEMLDAVEKERLHDKSSGMYLLFLAPVVTASMKLVVDMALFMMSFLSGTGVGL
jgi:hypothetical protein